MSAGVKVQFRGIVARKQSYMGKDNAMKFVSDVAGIGFTAPCRFETREAWESSPAEDVDVDVVAKLQPAMDGLFRLGDLVMTPVKAPPSPPTRTA